MELELAKEHIREMEQLNKLSCGNNDFDKLHERIKYLEQKESTLIQEGHELREQNELLEFRILELEETHDKVCVIIYYVFFQPLRHLVHFLGK